MLYLRKVLKVAIITMMVFVMFPCSAAKAAETVIAEKTKSNDDFEVTMQLELKGASDSVCGFEKINIKNISDSSFSGTLYARKNRDDHFISKYDISVGSGKTISLYDEMDMDYTEYLVMDIKIVGDNEKELFNDVFCVSEQDINRELIINKEICRYNIGVLSNNSGFISEKPSREGEYIRIFDTLIYGYYDQITYYSSMSKIKNDLKEFDYFIIDGYDTSALTTDEYEQIMTYVKDGGTLFLGTGTKAKEVLSGFSEVINYSTGDVVKKSVSKGEVKGDIYESYEVCQSYTYYYDQMDSQKVELWDNVWRDYYMGGDIEKKYPQYDWTQSSDDYFGYSFENGEEFIYDEVSLEIGNSSYIQQMNFFEENVVEKGKGKLIILPFEIGACNEKLNIDSFTGKRISYSSVSPENIIVKSDKTNVIVYIVIIVMYIVITFVLILLVVKKFDKASYVVVAVAISGVVFSVIFYVAARNLKIEDTLGYVTVNNYDNPGKVSSYTRLCLVNQENSKYTLNIDSEENVNNFDIRSFGVYGDLTYATEDWDESKGIVIDKTQGKTGRTIEINKVTPYSTCQFEINREIEREGRFEIENSTDGYTLSNNTGIDMRCVVLEIEGDYWTIGDMKNGEKIKVESFDDGEDEIDWKSFVTDDISKEEAMSVAVQYGILRIHDGNVRVYAIESFEADILSNEWEGMTIATQGLCSLEDLGVVSLGDWYLNSSIVGDYRFDYYTYDKSIQNKTVIYLDSNALMLYDVDKGKSLKSIYVADNDLNKIIMNNTLYTWAYDNPMILIYNYNTNEYDALWDKDGRKVITKTSYYYGANKPIRIKLLGIRVMPDIILEAN